MQRVVGERVRGGRQLVVDRLQRGRARSRSCPPLHAAEGGRAHRPEHGEHAQLHRQRRPGRVEETRRRCQGLEKFNKTVFLMSLRTCVRI